MHSLRGRLSGNEIHGNSVLKILHFYKRDGVEGGMREKLEVDFDLSSEFSGARLGDERRVKRLVQVANAWSQEPAASIPKATGTVAAQEAAYRLLRNEKVTLDGVLAGHVEQTVQRASEESLVLAVHDTTQFKFNGEAARDGLGPLRGHGQGFFAHVSMLVAPGELRRPLGVLGVNPIVRQKGGREKSVPRQEQEAYRWFEGADLVEKTLKGKSNVVHVMDREGDVFTLWSELLAADYRFVIRSSASRKLETGETLKDSFEAKTASLTRLVPLSRRAKDPIHFNRKRHPPREEREARLAIHAQTVAFQRPVHLPKSLPQELVLQVVHVIEEEPPEGQAPVEWFLVTTDSIAETKDIESIVDAYRSRWVIEEFFKALKTGCSFEKRQLESSHTIFNALGIFVPIAWRLLLIRSLSRRSPDAPATVVLTETQLRVLRATAHKPLPPSPTARDALLAVAALGGHIKNNGDPGWLVLGRGLETLLQYERGWRAARSDQS